MLNLSMAPSDMNVQQTPGLIFVPDKTVGRPVKVNGLKITLSCQTGGQGIVVQIGGRADSSV